MKFNPTLFSEAAKSTQLLEKDGAPAKQMQPATRLKKANIAVPKMGLIRKHRIVEEMGTFFLTTHDVSFNLQGLVLLRV
jgi:hypothetical protein